MSHGLVMTRVYRSRYDTCHVASSRYNIFQFLQFLAPLVIEEFYYFSDECYSDIKNIKVVRRSPFPLPKCTG